jgi:DNA polymerase-3 subunit epsilon
MDQPSLFGPQSIVVAIDFETANQSAASACQLGLVRLEDWRVVAQASWLIRPPTEEFLFTHIHGLTWADVRQSPSWGELWPEISGHLEGAHYLAAHNAPFDRGVLQAACAEHGLAAPATPFLDTVIVARKVWKIFPTKLNNVCEKLGITLNHHEALSDANACAEILARASQEGWKP